MSFNKEMHDDWKLSTPKTEMHRESESEEAPCEGCPECDPEGYFTDGPLAEGLTEALNTLLEGSTRTLEYMIDDVRYRELFGK